MRRDGWEAALASYLDAARTTAFAWGTADCALWAAGWVREATGQDFLSDWRGRYKTELGAKRLMTRRGFATVAAIADAALSAQPVPRARRGDLVLHPDGMLGVCAGRLSHFLTDAGTTALDTLACPRAWAVE